MKYKIAIAEDQEETRSQIHTYINKYGDENNIGFEVDLYENGAQIVDAYTSQYDIIFFDIEMPEIDGMEASKIIRQKDSEVVIVFITNLAQYAIEGYSVGALDFVLKPINYYAFSMRMERALERAKKKESKVIILNTVNGIVKFNSNDLYYVEIENRMLHYHTKLGEYVLRGTISSIEEQLAEYHFVKCNQCYLVNLKYVIKVKDNFVYVGKSKLEMSRRSKSSFIKALTDYYGETMM